MSGLEEVGFISYESIGIAYFEARFSSDEKHKTESFFRSIAISFI